MREHATLVTVDDLAAAAGRSNLKILDATYAMPNAPASARERFEAGHIPGAAFFDIDAVCDPESHLPHMLPPPLVMAEAMASLGIENDDEIVVYDATGLMSAARVWWTLRSFGHRKVAILDRGLRGWREAGLPIESGPAAPRARTSYAVTPPVRATWSKADMIANLKTAEARVVDARSSGRFIGVEAEPWPGRRSGHIPHSLNLSFESLSDETGALRGSEEIRQLFEDAGLDFARPVVVTCGSGVTACALLFALDRTGKTDVAVYDGSWAEWGLPGDQPIAIGPGQAHLS